MFHLVEQHHRKYCGDERQPLRPPSWTASHRQAAAQRHGANRWQPDAVASGRSRCACSGGSCGHFALERHRWHETSRDLAARAHWAPGWRLYICNGCMGATSLPPLRGTYPRSATLTPFKRTAHDRGLREGLTQAIMVSSTSACPRRPGPLLILAARWPPLPCVPLAPCSSHVARSGKLDRRAVGLSDTTRRRHLPAGAAQVARPSRSPAATVGGLMPERFCETRRTPGACES